MSRLVTNILGTALLALVGQFPASAAEWRLQAGGDLQAAIDKAADGDTVHLGPGVYRGNFLIRRPLSVLGKNWPILDAGGSGTVLRIGAPNVVIEGLQIQGSGTSLDEENSGIAVEADHVTLQNNRLSDVLFGIYLRRANGASIVGNEITGMDLALPRRGDAIRVWYSNGARLIGNQVRAARDVVLWYSENLEVRDNRVEDGRYGLHFMYCDDAQISSNALIDNSVGAFLMYSRRLRLYDNLIAGNHGPSGYGVGLKDMDDALVENNHFVGNRVGAYLDNSPRDMSSHSRIVDNLFAANDLGVRLMPNVRRSEFSNNSFVENREQVALAGGGGDPEANLWSHNHWSDYRGFDADGDGTGDVPYRSERLFESLADRHQLLRFFSYSPASRAIDFAARAFPLVRPQPKLIDERPSMAASFSVLAIAAGTTEPPSLSRLTVALFFTTLMLLLGPRWLYAQVRLAAAPVPVDGPVLKPRLVASGSMGRELVGPSISSAPLIEVEGVSKSFGSVVALADLSFTVGKGEAVALWGNNGAGKTTALRALLGVMSFDGDLRIGGFDVHRQGKKARQLIGFVPQETAFPDLRTLELLEFFARLQRASASRIPELLQQMGLETEVDKKVGSLSGGRKQRLALAVALLNDPPLLLLDEPTASLDVHARLEFVNLLRQLKDRGKTIVFSSHRPDEVRALADRVLHLDQGRVLADQPARLHLDEVLGVDLELWVNAEARDRAQQILVDRGFDCHRRGDRLVVHTATREKVTPISLLLEHKIIVEDFQVETEHVQST